MTIAFPAEELHEENLLNLFEELDDSQASLVCGGQLVNLTSTLDFPTLDFPVGTTDTVELELAVR